MNRHQALRRTGLAVVLTMMLIERTACAQEMSLRAVYNAISGVMAPIWVAVDARLFTKHGVKVDVKNLAATSAVQAMVGGGGPEVDGQCWRILL